MSGLARHDLPRPDGLIECDVVLDIGPGIRPMQWYKPERHICIEPYGPYAVRLEVARYEVIRKTAIEALQTPREGHAVYMLDVIEHMEKAEGQEVVDLAKRGAKQVVIYTPNGFLKQEGDAWKMGGEHWQKHRSGWVPDDFPGWTIQHHDIGFFAVCTA